MSKVLNKINCIENVRLLTNKECLKLSQEIREFLLENVSQTGGHLASNLGVVELTIALMRSFDFTKDKIIFDVGHQSYVYKILTGRKDKFKTLRCFKGLSGFPNRNESIYDFYDSGHSSSSISAGLGMARARDLKKKNFNVISLIGDAAITGGLSFEAMNDLGFNPTKMIIILNDNGMSISPNVGALSKYLNSLRLNKSYLTTKNKINSYLIEKEKRKTTKALKFIKSKLKKIVLPTNFFDSLNIEYIGPIDGHNIKEMTKVFNKVKNINKPIIIHVVTQKGRGYLKAETSADKYHGVSPFKLDVGISNSTKPTYSSTFGQIITDEALKNDKIVAITAAMKDGTGLSEFAVAFPNRLFDVGITEAHAVTLAAGLALEGYQPVVAIYSTFLQRSLDQIIIDICAQNLPVIFMVDRTGLVGEDGKTHQGIFTFSYLSFIPNLTILTPKCLNDLEQIFKYALSLNKPVAICIPRGGDNLILEKNTVNDFKWELLKTNLKDNRCLIATGKMVELAYEIAEEENITIINAWIIKPLDQETLNNIFQNYDIIYTLEDNVLSGGFGESVKVYGSNIGYRGKIINLGFNDCFVNHGKTTDLYQENKLDINSIKEIIKK